MGCSTSPQLRFMMPLQERKADLGQRSASVCMCLQISRETAMIPVETKLHTPSENKTFGVKSSRGYKMAFQHGLSPERDIGDNIRS